MAKVLRRWQQRSQREDAGFTLVELIVAMVVTLIVMTALLGVFVSTLSTVSAAKQRQAATALSNQRMEQLRATPYDDVTQSSGAAVAGDPNVSGSRFTPKALPGVDEELVVNGVSPQKTILPVDGVDYTVQTYVSKSGASGQQAFNLTVLTSWSSNVSNGRRTNVERSVTYSPSGCLSTTTHPFSGPCQASFSGNAGQLAASISVVNPEAGTANIEGFDGTRVALELPALRANLLLEQITNVNSAAATTGASVSRGATVNSSGVVRAAAAGDTDPSSPVGESQSVPIGSQTSAVQTLSGAAGELRVSPTTADTGNAGTAVTATPEQCKDGDSLGTMLTTGLPGAYRPCASANVQPNGNPGLLTYLPFGGAPSMVVASIGKSPVPMRAVAAHLISAANPNACSGASGAGCAHAAAFRSLGDVLIGGLPAGGGVLDAFTGSWAVTRLVESARSEAGIGATEPSYARQGTLNYWNGIGYTLVPLTENTVSTITPEPVTWTGTASGQPMTVTVSSTITLTKARAPATTGGDCKAKACEATSSGQAGVRGDTTYTVMLNGTQVTKFLVITDLGGLVAQTTYKAVPSA